jgi:hypothetical protein
MIRYAPLSHAEPHFEDDELILYNGERMARILWRISQKIYSGNADALVYKMLLTIEPQVKQEYVARMIDKLLADFVIKYPDTLIEDIL